MRGHRGTPRLAVAAAAVCLVVSLPFLVGQGCVGNGIEKIPGGLYQDTPTGLDGNTAPTFRFTAPAGPVRAEIGDIINVTWTDNDPDDNALISIILDPDSIVNNGNDVPIVTGILEDDPTNSLSINTGAYGLTTGNYRIVARISDGVNPEVMVAAPGQLQLSTPGLNPGNVSPTVVVTRPVTMLSVSDGTTVQITYCGNDRDGGEGGVVADVVILLDEDNDPLNDLWSVYDPSTPAAATALALICSDTNNLPLDVGGAVVLGCAKDPKCTNPANGTNYNLVVDTTRIPQTPDGEPYRVRVSMWDHTNPPVHGYAAGRLSLTALASGVVDLGDVGRLVTGSKFVGLDAGGQAGYTGTSLGDFDGDGADDFITVARLGRPFERGNIGSAYLVYGMSGQRYGGEIPLNSFGLTYRGMEFASGRTKVGGYILDGGDPVAEAAQWFSTPVTQGICAVAAIEDLTGDGSPEILFGLPYVEQMYDYYDDDPCDDDAVCYFDGFPNPASNGNGNDDIGAFDARENGLCSNDGDLTAITPINQGYVIYVRSDNQMEDTVLDISLAGQRDPGSLILEENTIVPGGTAPSGARLRGSYYAGTFSDQSQSFGLKLGSMPDLGDGGTIPEKDGAPEFLFSMPGAYSSRGAVLLVWGQDLSDFVQQEVKSIPDMREFGDCTRTDMVPDDRVIWGSAAGDEFGYADRAGDFNGDGHQDILCGAPGYADSAGVVYVIFGRLSFGDGQIIGGNYMPRLEIRGMGSGDRFGEVQTAAGDINNDGFPDVAFASKLADGPGGTDSGYIGIVFGGRHLTGENSFTVNQVGTSQLAGVVFYGTQRGGHAGAVLSNVGDFNADGFDDLMISAPNEVRVVDGQTRRGVAYLVFGGSHLTGDPSRSYFLLDEVGSDALPGIVFLSPYAQASADEATISWVGAAGDVDGDGFRDILVGLSEADFVNPYDPTQRRIDAGETYLIYGNNSGSNVIGK